MSRGLSEAEASAMIVSRLRRADHEGAAARVRGRDEPADPAADGRLGRLIARVERVGLRRPFPIRRPENARRVLRRDARAAGIDDRRGRVPGVRDLQRDARDVDAGVGRDGVRAVSGSSRVPERRRRHAAELEAAGVDVPRRDAATRGVCHMAFCSDFDGNTLILHRRYARASRSTARSHRESRELRASRDRRERVDFVLVPSRTRERAERVLPRRARAAAEPGVGRALGGVRDGNLTLALVEPEKYGERVRRRTSRRRAARGRRARRSKARLEEPAVEVVGHVDSGVCHMGFVKDPDGNVLILHRRYAPYEESRDARRSCSSATGRCRCRRRTTSPGASPTCAASTRTRSSAAAPATVAAAPSRCSSSTSPALAHVGEGGIEIERAPEGVPLRAAARGPPAAARARRLGREVRRAQRGGVAARPARPRPEGRRRRAAAVRARSRTRSRAARSSGACSSSPSRRAASTLIEEYASARPDLRGYSNAVAELFVEQDAKLEYVSIQNLSRETWHFATHHARVERDAELDWVAGGFGSDEGQGADPERPRRPGRDLARDGRVLRRRRRSTSTTTPSRSTSRRTRPRDFAFKGALRDTASAVWRGMIRVEKDAQKTNAYQENRNLLLSPKAHADSIPGLEILANDVRCTHGATLGQVDREQLFYLMARGLSRAGGGAADRARLLPGRARPHRARAGARRARRGARERASRRPSVRSYLEHTD